ncbi:hypothetical protein LZ318_28850 [Saccharopolyspora indica]|uniref:hypothetical protein n=1 Tax=Saccharopolyspora indica TaxID=1229659 RepID=UPI0022EB911B|nr:hypothetical protein [Saccharopolyspora indica]MDA3646306.1 hypothetical protein [Saccharopolyspora indica]
MAGSTELSAVPGVIPYVDDHDGARRLLVLEIPLVGNSAKRAAPIASIDGRQYVVTWGSVSFEVPADRNVHVSVHLLSSGGQDYMQTQFASVILPPDAGPVRLIARMSASQEGTIAQYP